METAESPETSIMSYPNKRYHMNKPQRIEQSPS